MAQAAKTTTAPARAPADTSTAPVDQDALSLKALAKAILAREFRPRVASVRRLAEAVLEDGTKASKPKKKKKKASTEKGAGKKRKLARIPGQAKAGQKKGRKKGK